MYIYIYICIYKSDVGNTVILQSTPQTTKNKFDSLNAKLNFGLISGSQISLWAMIGLNLLHQNTPNQVKCTVI